MAVRLGSTDLFDSLVIAHPGNPTIEQIKAIKKPASWACAEGVPSFSGIEYVLTRSAEDMGFKKPLRDEAEATFAARKDKPDYVDYEFKDYKGKSYPILLIS